MAYWYEPEIMCKKHPNQRQQPGFCSSCLNDRLSKLPSFTYNIPPPLSSSSASSSPAFNSSASSSTCASPMHRHHRKKSLGFHDFTAHGKNNGSRKSRSITNVPRRRSRSGLDGKKKEGFWSKLLFRSVSAKNKGIFVHANNEKERLQQ